MTARVVMFAVLIVLVALTGGTTAAQAPSGQIEERVLLDNDSVRIVLVTYPPGADSDLHLSLGPEITLVQDGELAFYAQGRREALRPGAAHWLPDGTTHLARNEQDVPVRFWSILLKRCD
jgi:quercetin dioxygenase-like cupin family protein